MRLFSYDRDELTSDRVKSWMPDFSTSTFNFKISVAQTLLYLLTILFSGDPVSPSICALLLFGGKYTPLIVERYQVHRLVLPIMLHSNSTHLLSNLIFQLRFGFSAEKYYGSARYVCIYILSGIGGNVLSAVFLPYNVSIGASSSIFGLLALLGIYAAYNWHKLGPGRDCNLLVYGLFMLYQFLVSFTTKGVDIYGHLGGYIVGIFTGLILLNRDEQSQKWSIIVKASMVGLVLYFGVMLVSLFSLKINCMNETCSLCDGMKLK